MRGGRDAASVSPEIFFYCQKKRECFIMRGACYFLLSARSRLSFIFRTLVCDLAFFVSAGDSGSVRGVRDLCVDDVPFFSLSYENSYEYQSKTSVRRILSLFINIHHPFFLRGHLLSR